MFFLFFHLWLSIAASSRDTIFSLLAVRFRLISMHTQHVQMLSSATTGKEEEGRRRRGGEKGEEEEGPGGVIRNASSHCLLVWRLCS